MEENTVVIIEPPRKKRRLWWIPVCIVLVLAIAAGAAWFFTADLRLYQDAQALESQGDYLGAAALYDQLADYSDAAEQARSARYTHAENLLDQRDYAAALAIYETLGDYEDSLENARECCYKLGKAALKDDALEEAIDYFTRAGDDYRDSRERRLETVYQLGHELFLDRKAEEAQAWFDILLAEAPEYYIPHFEEAQDALAYLKAIDEPIEIVTVVARSISPYYQNMIYWNVAVQQSLGYQFADVTYDEEDQTITLVPDYYPGQRIVWAWESGDFTILTQRELETYEAAVAIVAQAKDETESLQELELWLHDWVCENVEYDSPYSYVNPEDYVGLDELTCVGAILDGKANCQGYTDAFYLLGTLAGMKVHKVFGTVAEGGHCWNAVRLDDWLYTVDTTFNDTYCEKPKDRTYIWYNNAMDMNERNANGGVSQFDRMVFLQDESKTYYAQEGMIFDDLDSAVLKLLKRYRKNGSGVDTALIHELELDQKDFYNAVSRNLSTAGVTSAQWWVAFETYKEASYLTVYWY